MDLSVSMDLEEVKGILHRHRSSFQKAYVYGSVARGTQDEFSDVDMLLIRDTAKPFFDRIREVMDLVWALRAIRTDFPVARPISRTPSAGQSPPSRSATV